MIKKESLYFQLLALLVLSAAAAALAFLGLNYAGETAVDRYYESTDYENKKNQSYVRRLQSYIDKNQLSSRDMEQLNAWVTKQGILQLCVYKDDMLIFDSEYPEQEFWNTGIAANNYEWENYYAVTFSDGAAEVTVWGAYAYQLYNYAQIAELVLSFLLFLALVLFGIHKKMNYILRLSDEIGILEGGGLDYKITVEGRDELAALAEGLDSMRVSFQGLIEQETRLMQENNKIVTEMSHDIRTPVTSILLYTEILKKGRYRDAAQQKEYIEIIDKKAHRLKQLTEHLFEYSLITGGQEVELTEPEDFELVFYDLISETCAYLEQSGFTVDFQAQWAELRVRVSPDYLTRIMDNITSNIVKYADPSAPVAVRLVNDGKWAGFSFENTVRRQEERAESTRIGIQSIQGMMGKMKGECRVRQEADSFCIEILFPVKKNFR